MGMFDGILGGSIIGASAATKLLDSYIEKQGGLQNVVSQFDTAGLGDTNEVMDFEGTEFADHGGTDSAGARLFRHGEAHWPPRWAFPPTKSPICWRNICRTPSTR